MILITHIIMVILLGLSLAQKPTKNSQWIETIGIIVMLVSGMVILSGLAGCSTQPIKLAYQCPGIELPPDPSAPVTKLNEQSQPDEIVKAWVATAVGYRDWNIIVRKQITDTNNRN
jgi:hypothetical protein